MKKYILYPHNGSGNHGCEAIVRTTISIIEGIPNSMPTLFSERPEEDKLAGIDGMVSVAKAQRPLKHWQKLLSAIAHKITNTDDRLYRYRYAPIFRSVNRNTVALSIGGDNYCYAWVDFLYAINKYIRKKGATTVLWGCSIEPDDMDEQMLADLREYAVIIARESITFNAMKENGLKNVKLFPDPAFQLKKINVSLPETFEKGNTIGINISPLILKYEKEPGITMKAYETLINHILTSTTMHVALIPHVVTVNGNDDLIPLSKLYNLFKNTGRVALIQNHNAMELKGFISQCRMFIGARTHATIAAYSSCVPTLVVGYSVKARGIARDIFGNEENLVFPVQELNSTSQLIDAFKNLMKNEEELKTVLKKVMPNYIEKAGGAREVIVDLVNRHKNEK